MTGGRLKRVANYPSDDDAFCLTYGVGDINVTALIAFHRRQGTLATVTATRPPGRFGARARRSLCSSRGQHSAHSLNGYSTTIGGDYIRNEEGYRAIFSDTFEKVRMIVREDYARVPFTFRRWARHQERKLNYAASVYAKVPKRFRQMRAAPCREMQRMLEKSGCSRPRVCAAPCG